MELFQDRVGGCGPAKRLGVLVVRGHEVIDMLHELPDAGERAAPNGFVGNQREESLDLVEPGAVGRDEVHVPARPARKPGLDLRVAVRCVVVEDAVHLQLDLHGLVDRAQERQELLVPTTV